VIPTNLPAAVKPEGDPFTFPVGVRPSQLFADIALVRPSDFATSRRTRLVQQGSHPDIRLRPSVEN
jgi:hypothetical protein